MERTNLFLIDKNISDSQCGFKVLPTYLFLNIKDRLRGQGFCFDIELLLTLRRLKVDLQEVPIEWQDQRNGSVNIFLHGPIMVWELIKIRLRALKWGNINVTSQFGQHLEGVQTAEGPSTYG
jgi:hypothetical protein